MASALARTWSNSGDRLEAFSIVQYDLSHWIIINAKRSGEANFLSVFSPLSSGPAEVFIIFACSLCPVRRQQMDNTLQLNKCASGCVTIHRCKGHWKKGTTQAAAQQPSVCLCEFDYENYRTAEITSSSCSPCFQYEENRQTCQAVECNLLAFSPGQRYCDATSSTASSCKIRTRRPTFSLAHVS